MSWGTSGPALFEAAGGETSTVDEVLGDLRSGRTPPNLEVDTG
jgi:hypothetical protein